MDTVCSRSRKILFSTIGTFEQELQSRQLKYIKSGFDFHYSSKKRGHYIDNIEISSQIIPTAEPEIPTESEVQFIDIEALTYASAKLYFQHPLISKTQHFMQKVKVSREKK